MPSLLVSYVTWVSCVKMGLTEVISHHDLISQGFLGADSNCAGQYKHLVQHQKVKSYVPNGFVFLNVSKPSG